jgi:tetratricopeptide (TPR) repeat protein
VKRRAISAAAIFFALLLCWAAASSGCRKSQTSTSTSQRPRAATSQQVQYRNDLLHNATSLINAPEQYDNPKATEEIVARLEQWRRLAQEATKTGLLKPEISQDPSAGSDSATKRQKLIETLPENLVSSRWIRHLDDDAFDPNYDGTFLRETALLRDVTDHIDAQAQDDVSKASALFDWCVRNIQIEPPPAAGAKPDEQWSALHMPLDTLHFGRGTPLARAWVFMLLARQKGLDVVLLATGDPRSPEQLRPWITALASGGELYLFDYTYGLPIPGPGGKGVATLAQAAADDSILRQMDIAGDRAYPRKSADLQNVTVLLEASPGYLERRTRLLEAELVGFERMILSTEIVALAEGLQQAPHVGQVKLWPQPYEVLEQRRNANRELRQAADIERLPFSIPDEPDQIQKQETDAQRPGRLTYGLRLGRLLQLRGLYGASEGRRAAAQGVELSAAAERGAKFFYLHTLPSEEQLSDMKRDLREGNEIARGVRLTPQIVDAFQMRRDDAAFWLGLISFEQGDYRTAAQYFGSMTLEAYPDGPWTNAARYNLARVREATGELPEAIRLYEQDKSPQRYGNRLRAERLKSQLPPAPAANTTRSPSKSAAPKDERKSK